MRKILSVLLSALMIASLLCFGVSAAAGTAVKSADDFAAMDPAGTYYLDADITVKATYGAGETPVPFTGVLDGNGHTVTVEVPMFEKFSGTLKNVTIKGAVSVTGEKVWGGAVAGEGPKNSTIVFENVTNNANVTGEYRTGGLIGQISNGSTLTMTNCVNNGAIKGGNMVGGFIGYQQGAGAEIQNCVNNGSVSIDTDKALIGLAGGIVGRYGGDTATANTSIVNITNCFNKGAISSTSEGAGIMAYGRGCTANITNCTNEGTINSTGSDAAGIFGSSNVTTVGDTKNVGNSFINISKCVNKGDCTTGKGRAAGIGGYTWAGGGADGVSTFITITDNVNYGTITGTSYASQIFTYANDKRNVVSGNVGLGKVAGADAKLSFFSFSSAAIPDELKNNIIVEDGTVYQTWTTAGAEDARTILIGAADPAALKVAPKADAEAAVKALGDIGYKAPAAPVTPADPGTPVKPVQTADTAVYFVAVAVVAVLGCALISRKVTVK